MNAKLTDLKNIISQQMAVPGFFQSAIQGVKTAKREQTSGFVNCFCYPSCILVLQGAKEMFFGKEKFSYSSGDCVISCADIPIASRITEASQNKPFLSIYLELDLNLLANLIIETNIPNNKTDKFTPIAIAKIDENTLDAFYRLGLLLTKSQAEQEILSPMIIKEIYYRLLTGFYGKQLVEINAKEAKVNKIARAIQLLKEKFSEKLNIEDIAQYVNMSASSFYRNFKKITQVTPLQYQKHLRLHEAQKLMLTENYNASIACYKVGYESATQFSREYKKLFGTPPITHIKELTT